MGRGVPLLLLLLLSGTLSAQQLSIQPSHRINNHSSLELKGLTSPPAKARGQIDIVGVRVSFQPDSNRFTTGDGTFSDDNLAYLDTTTITIDPLPHDSSYFMAHLRFAANYYHKVSGGQLSLNYRLLPGIYQLDHKMAHYSPTGRQFSLEPLARLIRDVWQKVEAQGGFETAGLNPRRTAFVIFHAGVGRDLQLTGTSLKITPQDIPSIYLGPEQLNQNLDQFASPGFPINEGRFHVNNSMIIPRTLSRPGTSFGNEFVLQMSINGLLAASIGSYLGLPDLFNTKTGNSGIGRFGLMDGASFFSYRGLFPPEPSAWEKAYLGWQDPAGLRIDEQRSVELPAVSRHRPKSIGRYEISSDEYFLVENRHRDPQHDGATLTIETPDGSTTQQHFAPDNRVFAFQQQGFDTLFTPGVVTDVDNFDYSLPGGLALGSDDEKGTGDDRLLNGGILIWHIDEAVIEANLEEQQVNNNPERRGVDLEEADGVQDIGSTIETGIGGADTRGSPYDFWWSGNNYSVVTRNDTISLYQNRFGPDTQPSNHSNTGAPSFFAFTDFSDNQPMARFKVVPAHPKNIRKLDLPVDRIDATFTPAESNLYYKGYPWDLSIFKTKQDSFLIIPAQNAVYAVRIHGPPNNAVKKFNIENPQQPFLGQNLVLGQAPAVVPPEESSLQRTEAKNNKLPVAGWRWGSNQWNKVWTTRIPPHLGFLSSGSADTLQADLGTARIHIPTGKLRTISGAPFQESERKNGSFARIYRDRLVVHDGSQKQRLSLQTRSSPYRLYTGVFPTASGETGFYVLREKQFSLVLTGGEDAPTKRTLVDEEPIEWPAMVDFNRDRRTDLLYVNREQNKLYARNQQGAVLDHFPIPAPDGTKFMGTPIVADVNGNKIQDILIVGQDSLSMNIYGYNSRGEPLASFPLYVGSVVGAERGLVHPVLSGRNLYAISHEGDIKGWRFPDMGKALWRSRYNQARNNKVSGSLDANRKPEKSSQILKYTETYNWPNPSDKMTHIRYQIRDAGKVEIRIITMSGNTIYRKTFHSPGGMPEEQRISTADWASGVYYAMVKGTVNGRSEKKLIKIAVVH